MKNIKVIVENALRSVFEFENQDMSKAKMLVEFKDILTQKEKNMIAYAMNHFGTNKDTIIEQNSSDSLNGLNVRQVLKCMGKFKDHVTKQSISVRSKALSISLTAQKLFRKKMLHKFLS